MTAGDPPAVRGNEPSERYEQLRAQALGGKPEGFRLGMAVLLRGGLAAWMHAWASVDPSPSPSGAPQRVASPGGRSDELVSLLTSMALACKEV